MTCYEWVAVRPHILKTSLFLFFTSQHLPIFCVYIAKSIAGTIDHPDLTNMAVPTPRAPRVSIENKIDSICSLIQQLNLTPKSFLVSFLEHDSGNASFRQRMWGGKSGWDSTLDLILKIKKLACHHREGHKLWEGFILSEVSRKKCTDVFSSAY
jgi:hypothetical protein